MIDFDTLLWLTIFAVVVGVPAIQEHRRIASRRRVRKQRQRYVVGNVVKRTGKVMRPNQYFNREW